MPDTKNIPIRWGKYINHDMEEEKVMFIGAEKAIYDSNGRRLDEKLVDMEGSLSDAFSETKDYAVGEYCVYTNRVFKFTKAKTAGEWDGTAVIPVSLAQEISEVSRGIAALNSHLLDKTFVSDLFAEANAGLNAKRVVLCNQDTLNTPYKEGITGTAKEGTAYINMTSANYGEIVYFPSGGNNIFITHKAVTWRGWYQVALKSDLPTLEANAKKISVGIDDRERFWFTIISLSGIWYSLNVSEEGIRFMKNSGDGWKVIWSK